MVSITASRAENLSIGALARLTGVNIETIRYYERIALLAAPPRSSGGRRVYGAAHARALAFIRRARELGFSINDIRALLALARPGTAPCAEVEGIARAHLEEVRAKLADLARLERILAETVSQCSAGGAATCPVLDMLGTDPDG